MDETALAEAYEGTVDEVYRYACRLTGGDQARAEDLTQDAYLSLVKERRAGRLDEVSPAWLVTCVRNRSIDRHHTASRRRRVLVAALVGTVVRRLDG